MNNVFCLFLSLSLSGSLLTVLLLLLKPLLKMRLSRTWQYYIYLIVVLRLLVPIGTESNLMHMLFHGEDSISLTINAPANSDKAPQASTSFTAAPPSQWVGDTAGDTPRPAAPGDQQFFFQWAWLLWLVPSAIMLCRKILGYHRFIRSVRINSVALSNESIWKNYRELCVQMKIRRPPNLALHPGVAAPMLIGSCHPIIVLPNAAIPTEQLCYILRHELIHYKRLDLIYKWLVQIALCLHWYNPFVYWVSREINRNCELSCDEAVITQLDQEGKRVYGDTLLDSIRFEPPRTPSIASITLSSDKQLIKERLVAIMHYKKTPLRVRVISVALVLVLLWGALLTGVYAAADSELSILFLPADQFSVISSSQTSDVSLPQSFLLNVSEDNKKIMLRVDDIGIGMKTVELIAPSGNSVRKYWIDQDGVMAKGSQEWAVIGGDLVLATDLAQPGLWTLNIVSPDRGADAPALSGRLVEPHVLGFVTDAREDVYQPASKSFLQEDTLHSQVQKDRIYDSYRSYAEALADVNNGYVYYMNQSFDLAAMPTVTTDQRIPFQVYQDNVLDISIGLQNLFERTDRTPAWWPDSFVRFELYDPSGKAVYSFYREGKDIREPVNLEIEVGLYPGEWQYNVSFAYIANGVDTSTLTMTAKYHEVYSEEVEWLRKHKLHGEP